MNSEPRPEPSKPYCPRRVKAAIPKARPIKQTVGKTKRHAATAGCTRQASRPHRRANLGGSSSYGSSFRIAWASSSARPGGYFPAGQLK